MSVISGKAYWAFVHEANTTFEPTWSIDVSLDEANKAIVEADGLKWRNKGDERGDFITIKRKVTKSNGNPNEAPEVVDHNKRILASDKNFIGPASVVNVQYRTYEWNYKGNAGIGADLQKVQLLELEELPDTSDDELPVVESGYSASDSISEEVPFNS